MAPLSSPKINAWEYLSKRASKLSLRIILPSTCSGSSSKVGLTSGTLNALLLCSLYKWELNLVWDSSKKFLVQAAKRSFSLLLSPSKYRIAFLALEAISFLIGSSIAIKSFFNLVIKILFILELAAFSNKFTNTFFCSLWGVKNSSQASLRALRTCLFIFFSSDFNSSSVEILFSNIHSL